MKIYESFYVFLFSMICYPSSFASLSERLAIETHKAFLYNCLNGYANVAGGCATEFDLFWNCWPSHRVNETVQMPCSKLFFETGGIDFKGMQKAKCQSGGKWAFQRESCRKYQSSLEVIRIRNTWILDHFKTQVTNQVVKEIKENRERDFIKLVKLAETIAHWVRYINLTVCSLTLILILWLVPFKVKRFTLHRFLILGLIMTDIFDILRLHYMFDSDQQSICTNMYVISTYFYMVVLLMMFSEGLYQFRQFYFIIVTNYREPTYVAVSYTLAAILVFGVFLPGMQYDAAVKQCWSFYFGSRFRWVLNAAIIVILLLNFLIMIYMMVLISSKLKKDRRSKMERIKKGAKGFMTLILMVGFCYAISYLSESEVIAVRFIVAVVQPSQGIWICLFQVLFSRQINKALRKKAKRFNDSKKIEQSFSKSRSTASAN